MKITKIASMALLTAGIASAGTEQVKSAFEQMMDEGKVNINARLRYEGLEVRSGSNLDALTLRTRVGFTTGEYNGFKAMIEMEDVSSLSQETHHPADPLVTELNQFWGSYTAENYDVKFGRQVYALDNHRFIGHVGWRQNIQTFDAITSNTSFIPGVDLKLAFLEGQNNVLGKTSSLEGYIVNATSKINDNLTLQGFGYSLQFDGNPAAKSTDTLGFTAKGKFSLADQAFGYVASVATQTDNSSSPSGRDLDNSYYDLQLNTKIAGFTFGLGYEVLGGNGATGFTTPLATLHKFNGFADQFLGASASGGLTSGLVDQSASVGYKLPIGNGLSLKAIYHQFETEAGEELGTEIDFVAVYPISKSIKFLTKYGNYSGDDSTIAYGNGDRKMISAELNFVY